MWTQALLDRILPKIRVKLAEVVHTPPDNSGTSPTLPSDEWYIALLAVLERHGAADPNDLAEELPKDRLEVDLAFAELTQRKLVTSTRGIMQINRRGKTVLDRLALHHDIIRDVLDELELKEEERNNFREEITLYRDRAYARYLNSLGSLHIFRVLGQQVAQRKINGRGLDWPDRKLGMITLLIRDLRSWNIGVPQTATLQRLAYKSGIQLQPSPNKTNAALQLLNFIEDTTTPENSTHPAANNPIARLLWFFHSVQRQIAQDSLKNRNNNLD